MNYIERAEKLEQQARELRELHQRTEEAKAVITIGRFIYDVDADKVAKVTGLANGSIDFSADYVDGSYSRGYRFVSGNWRLATPDEVGRQGMSSVSATIAQLKTVLPGEIFREEPASATEALLALEVKYNLNTVDFLKALYNNGIDDDDLDAWLNEYETFKLFRGNEAHLNQQTKPAIWNAEKKRMERIQHRFIVHYRDEETLERLKEMDIISYLPGLHEQLKFLFVNSALTRSHLEAIDGVESITEPRTGHLCGDGESQ